MSRIIYFLLPILFLAQHVVLSQSKEQTAKFEQYLKPYVDSRSFSGQILISQKGKILFNKAYGYANLEFSVPNDVNTEFHIMSITKSFTAAAILILEQRELLTTEDPVSKYVPDYPQGNKITIHHLLSHTSGIPDINDLPEYKIGKLQHQTPATLMEMYKNKPLEFQPGEDYQYSNSNYSFLAFIVERLSKKTFGEFLKENIFIPVGMTHTLHHDDMSQVIPKLADGYVPDGHFGLQKTPYLDWTSKTGSGTVISTAEDLNKWNVALLGTSILSDASKKKMFTEYKQAGYGWYLGKQNDRNYIFMNGLTSGFSAHIGRYPEEEVCVIVLSNYFVYISKQMALDLAGIVFNKPVDVPAFSRKLTDDESKQIVGRYQFGKDFYKKDYVLEVKIDEGKVVANYGEFIPNKPFEFLERPYGGKVKFVKDASGRVDAVTIDGVRGEKLE
ncbi:MAG TPA: serine hydrolase domain-containing protein [Cyclobacteriaceae bacterium]|nr:serine hydrolase domain-containing protein [Cyclobacteriaceae bacterium]